MFKSKAEEWVHKLTDIFNLELSPIEFEALFHVLSIFSEQYFSLVSEKQWTNVICVSKDFLRMTQNCKGISFCLLRPQICELLLKLEVQRDLSGLDALCCEMLRDDMYEVKHTVLDFLSCLQSNINSPDKLCRFFKSLDIFVYEHCKVLISDGPNNVINIFVNIVLEMFFSHKKYDYHREEKVKILLVLRGWKNAILRVIERSSGHPEIENLDFLVSCCRDSHDEVALNSIYCLKEFMYLKVSLQSLFIFYCPFTLLTVNTFPAARPKPILAGPN